MMKKMCLILFLFFLHSPLLFAYQPPKELVLTIQFDSAPNKLFHVQPLHFNKIVTIDPNEQFNHIVETQSEIVKNFPITLAMLVKPVNINDQQTELEFNLVHYGFVRNGSVLLQPKMILLNGQHAELQTDLFTLKVTANWPLQKS